VKPIHWVVAFVQATLFPYVVVTATALALPNQGPYALAAAGIFGAGCALAGFVLVYEYAQGKAELT
jgi:hypothetical protein